MRLLPLYEKALHLDRSADFYMHCLIAISAGLFWWIEKSSRAWSRKKKWTVSVLYGGIAGSLLLKSFLIRNQLDGVVVRIEREIFLSPIHGNPGTGFLEALDHQGWKVGIALYSAVCAGILFYVWWSFRGKNPVV